MTGLLISSTSQSACGATSEKRNRPVVGTTARARTDDRDAATLARLGLAAGDRVRVRQGGGEAILAAGIDAALPDGTVRVARGVPETAALGEGEVSVERMAVAAVA